MISYLCYVQLIHLAQNVVYQYIYFGTFDNITTQTVFSIKAKTHNNIFLVQPCVVSKLINFGRL